MKELVQDFPKQLKTALELAEKQTLSADLGDGISHILIVGLGGSAFGGEISRNLMLAVGKVPVSIHRNYGLPNYLNTSTLCLLCSYSGNTEETLDAAELAVKAGAKCVAISSGGKLKAFAEQHAIPFVELPGDYPPRAAVGLSFVQQIAVLTQAGLYAGDYTQDVKESIQLLEAFDKHDEVKALANRLKGRIPIIYATDAADAIAIRLRQQINENGKQLCWHHIIPEMNHNELVGWHHPEALMDQLHVLFLHTSADHKRNRLRIELNEEIIKKHTPHTTHIHAKGESHLAQLLYLLHYSDWLSVYLADVNDVEATPVKVIDYLKGELAKR